MYKDFVAYHYFYNNVDNRVVEYNNKLLPINYLQDGPVKQQCYADYANRARELGITSSSNDIEAGEKYFEFSYNTRYYPVLGKPYKHYGIYLTPLDLFKFPNRLKYRVRIDCNNQDLDNWLIGIRKNMFKLTYPIYKMFISKFSDYNLIERLYSLSRFAFQKLPEIVCFDDYIKFNTNDIEDNVIRAM